MLCVVGVDLLLRSWFAVRMYHTNSTRTKKHFWYRGPGGFSLGLVHSITHETAGQSFDDFSDPHYMLQDGFTSIASVIDIASRAGRVMVEEGEQLSFGTKVEKVVVEEVKLEPNIGSDKM